ncbi:MAG TPA: M2 family metallopeptidase [Kofleriaceae bacterium]|nr:M2 family metallopeptidase [Kofleriaceae bacterium]
MRTSKLLPLMFIAACGGPKKQPAPPAPAPEPTAGAPAVAPVPTPAPPPGPNDAALVAEATEFAKHADEELRKLYVDSSVADWANQTDITPEHEAASAKASEALANGLTKLIKESRKFERVLPKLDPDTRRQLWLLKIAGQPAPDDPAQAEQLAKIAAEMTSIYGKGKVCDASKPKAGAPKQAQLDDLAAKLKAEQDPKKQDALKKDLAAKQKKFDQAYCKDLDALSKVLQKSRKPDELLAAWKGWNDNVGKAIRPLFTRYVEIANAGARGVGFKDVAEMWKSGYDMPPDQFEKEVDRLWNQVRPLYVQLHCYTRRGLNKLYGDNVVSKTGPIPSHLTGNMWAQAWGYLYKELQPYPGVAPIDVTPTLEKKFDYTKMVKMAEGFYMSLGMNPLPKTFWERSMFQKPKGKDVVCHASAWDVTLNNDLRIKMCINKNQEDLVTIHHELGHNYYYNNYYTLPALYQNGANDGFHEAIGDTIALSMTPEYMKQKGLLTKVEKNEKATINQQMDVALEKIAFLPFGLLVDKWRWDVFSGKVKPDEYNKHWWDLKLKYQGVAPPIARTEAEFDPGAKYHIPANTPYMRYFLAAVLQFQFHRALCQKAGFKGPLNECSIYGNKEAGEAFKKMLAMGASKPWQDALFELTGQREMDATAILEYFAPLQKWLEEQNKGQQCGW